MSELEEQLERSWENGFDREGASHFGGGVCGRSAWIGATDVAAMLASMGFRPRVVDFGVRQPSEGERHGRDRSRYCLNCGEKIGGEIEGVEAAWLENLACSERCVCLACVHNGKESSEMLHCLEAWRWRVPQRLAGRVETTAAGRPWTAAELLLAWVWEYFGVAGRGGGESDSAGRGGGESDSAWRESGESDSAGRGKSNSACPISGAASDPITMPRPPEFRVTRPRLPPLYLQRPGHSVVVIGAQMQGPEEGACLADAAGGCAEAGAPLDLEACRRVALWILDPGPAAPEAARALEERDAGIWRRLLLLDCRTLSCWRQFQIVWVARAGEERAAELERDAHKVVAAAEWY